MRRTASTALLTASLLLAACSSGDTTDPKPSSTPATGPEARYDEIWNTRSPGLQATVCKELASDGPESVSVLLGENIDEPSVDMKALAEYIDKEKC